MSEDVHETTERVLESFAGEPTVASLAGRVFRERGGDVGLVQLTTAAEDALGPRTSGDEDATTDEVAA